MELASLEKIPPKAASPVLRFQIRRDQSGIYYCHEIQNSTRKLAFEPMSILRQRGIDRRDGKKDPKEDDRRRLAEFWSQFRDYTRGISRQPEL